MTWDIRVQKGLCECGNEEEGIMCEHVKAVFQYVGMPKDRQLIIGFSPWFHRSNLELAYARPIRLPNLQDVPVDEAQRLLPSAHFLPEVVKMGRPTSTKRLPVNGDAKPGGYKKPKNAARVTHDADGSSEDDDVFEEEELGDGVALGMLIEASQSPKQTEE
jgi:hypothetical protein